MAVVGDGRPATRLQAALSGRTYGPASRRHSHVIVLMEDTTRLCLLWLRAELTRSVRGQCSVLDYGCGSGILSIAARKLGAPRVVGADIDPQALSASAENARLNAVEASFVAPDALRRFLHNGPRDLTGAKACELAAARLCDAFAGVRDGVDAFLNAS